MKHIVSANANRYIGIMFIIISAVSFGAMPIFARLAYASGADPVTVLFLRFGMAAAVMLGIMFVSKTPFLRGLILLELILLGAIGYVGESLAYFTALTIASAGLVALLLYIYPALVTALSAIFLKEHLTTPMSQLWRWRWLPLCWASPSPRFRRWVVCSSWSPS